MAALAEALRALAKDEADRRIATWLDDVIDRVERLADTPTKGQMQGALGMAEISVHTRLDEIWAGIAALQAAEQGRAKAMTDLIDSVDALALGFKEALSKAEQASAGVGQLAIEVGEVRSRVDGIESRLSNQSTLIATQRQDHEAVAEQLTTLQLTVDSLAAQGMAQDEQPAE